MRRLDYDAVLETNGVPVVALAGTCMEAGKTAAACAMISRIRHRGLVVDGFKATGVSLRRDILAMEDSGARRSMIFTDLGIVTTTAASGPALTRTMLTEMTKAGTDVVVFELGDGILGAYGVEAILASEDIRRALSAVILSANDPVAAWGGVKLLRERFGIEPCCGDRPGHRQRGRREDHRGADGGPRGERDVLGCRARRPHHREPRPRSARASGAAPE